MLNSPEQPGAPVSSLHRKRLSPRKAILFAALLIIIVGGSIGLITRFLPSFVTSISAPPTTSNAAGGINAPMFGNDARHTHFNPHEHLLTSSTISHLVPGWASTAAGGSFFSSPAIAHGIAYIGSLDGKLYAFRAGGCGSTSCAPLWTASTGDRIVSSPAVAGGIVYVGSYDHKLYAFPANGCARKSCAPLWTSTLAAGSMTSSPAIADGVVYIGTEQGALYAFPSAGCGQTTCSPLWSSSSIGHGCSQSPCAALLKSYPTRSGFSSSPAVDNGMVYIGSLDSRLYAFQAKGCGKSTCAPAWRSIETGGVVESSPAVANGVVYIGSWDHKLYAFQANGCGNPTCSPLWTSSPTTSIIESSPFVAGEIVYIGSVDTRIYAYRADGCNEATCLPLWISPPTGGAVESSPTVVDGSLYIGSLDHRLYGFHVSTSSAQSFAQTSTTPTDQPIPTQGCGRSSPIAPGTSANESIAVNPAEALGHRTRTYLLHLPGSYQGNLPLPVILAFSGYGGSAASMERGTGFSQLAEQDHFIAVYPQGLPDGNGGAPYWANVGPIDYGIDDLQYVSNVLDDVQHRLCIDARRIYASGFSNGAGMVGLLACRLAGRIAAFAPVSGDFFTLPGGCHPDRPVPLLYVHGTADPFLPYYSGTNEPAWPLPPIPRWLSEWAERDGCSIGPAIFLQTSKITGEKWTACRGDGTVIHYRIEGGGHAWPTVLGDRPGVEVMWNFFQSHPLLPA